MKFQNKIESKIEAKLKALTLEISKQTIEIVDEFEELSRAITLARRAANALDLQTQAREPDSQA